MLLHVMEQLNVPKEQTVLVGDSTNDINGGHNAGIRVCAVGYGMGNRSQNGGLSSRTGSSNDRNNSWSYSYEK